jgi:recombination protein RecR
MLTPGVPSLERVIDALARLPGIGRKTAQRLSIFILKSDEFYARELSESILNLKAETQECIRCFNITEQKLCPICRDPGRDHTKICVVEDIVDILAIEASSEYKGLYHVLGGVISPLNRVSPDDLHIKELVERVREGSINEILMAINPSTEGEATMIYISRLLREYPVRLTRIASGIPIGSSLEYLDQATIGRAILKREDL